MMVVAPKDGGGNHEKVRFVGCGHPLRRWELGGGLRAEKEREGIKENKSHTADWSRAVNSSSRRGGGHQRKRYLGSKT